MTLTPDERQAIITYRLEKAYDTLHEAKFSFNAGFWNLTANRLYYATFYACEALLCRNHVNVNSHAGVSRMMSLNFVRTGIISTEDSRLLKELFRMRQTGDYDDLFDWSRDDVEPLLPKAEELIGRLAALTNSETAEECRPE